MQVFTLPPNWDGYPEHDHGEGTVDPDQEEVYVPLEGSATLVAGEEHFDLRPGVTEVYLHPALDTDELRASHPDWSNRVEDHMMLTRDPSFADLVERAGATLIGFRELRELQRS